MFKEVNSVTDVDFEVAAPVVRQVCTRPKIEWRDELIAFGLQCDRLNFSLKGGIAPIRISLADAAYESKCGTNPRINVSNTANKDSAFIKVCEQVSLEVVRSVGLSIKGYDFADERSVKELGSFLLGFEKAYRKVKSL